MSVSVVEVFSEFLKLIFDNVNLNCVSLSESPCDTRYKVSFSVTSTGACPIPELVHYDDVYVRLHMHKVRDFQFVGLNVFTVFNSSNTRSSSCWVADFKQAL